MLQLIAKCLMLASLKVYYNSEHTATASRRDRPTTEDVDVDPVGETHSNVGRNTERRKLRKLFEVFKTSFGVEYARYEDGRGLELAYTLYTSFP